MRYIVILAILLGGCATTPDPWQGLTVETAPATTPLACGSFPYPTKVEGEDLVYDNAGANDLEAYRVCSEANQGIAKHHAMQIDSLKRSRAALVSAGQGQKRISDMKQEMLESERVHHVWQSVGYWILIVGLAL